MIRQDAAQRAGMMPAAPAGPARASAVEEVPFRLEVNGRVLASWTCSPGHLAAQALGWLVSAGYHEPGEVLPRFEPFEDPGVLGIRAELPAASVRRGDAERRHRAEHGCGSLYVARCAPEVLRGRPRRLPVPESEALAALFRELFAATGRDREVGGLHSAALTDGRMLRLEIHEVGRHNAVDKVIGRALLEGADLADTGLLLTARISGEIALKAARGGIAWIASRSIPTTLALQVAEVADLPLVARAAGRDRRIHEPAPEREPT